MQAIGREGRGDDGANVPIPDGDLSDAVGKGEGDVGNVAHVRQRRTDTGGVSARELTTGVELHNSHNDDEYLIPKLRILHTCTHTYIYIHILSSLHNFHPKVGLSYPETHDTALVHQASVGFPERDGGSRVPFHVDHVARHQGRACPQLDAHLK